MQRNQNILRLFPFSRYLVNNFLLKTRGAKDFAGRIASHLGSVVVPVAGNQSGTAAGKFV